MKAFVAVTLLFFSLGIALVVTSARMLRAEKLARLAEEPWKWVTNGQIITIDVPESWLTNVAVIDLTPTPRDPGLPPGFSIVRDPMPHDDVFRIKIGDVTWPGWNHTCRADAVAHAWRLFELHERRRSHCVYF